MSRPKRIIQWFWWHEDNWPDWLADTAAYDTLRRWVARAECAIRGHKPERDQCNRPEHDHCGWCGKPMPWQAPIRRAAT